MTPPDYEYLRKLLKDHSGLDLSADKQYLIESRLAQVARAQGFASIDDLATDLGNTGFNSLHRQVVEAMTTNETSFFRDHHPFEALQHRLLPELIAARASERTTGESPLVR